MKCMMRKMRVRHLQRDPRCLCALDGRVLIHFEATAQRLSKSRDGLKPSGGGASLFYYSNAS